MKTLNYLKGNLFEARRKFIRMHLDAKVPSVGLPIDEIRATKKRVMWQGKSDHGCPP
jgi:hypothetical protein